jgi:chitin-binding protein
VFDGGNGEVTGIGVTATPPSSTPCHVSYAVTSSWPGGFQAQVTVSNPTTATMYGWTVSWVMPDGQTINSAWNGTLSQAGSLATVKSADWNRTLAPNGTASFGFTANYPASPVVPASITCQSP